MTITLTDEFDGWMEYSYIIGPRKFLLRYFLESRETDEFRIKNFSYDGELAAFELKETEELDVPWQFPLQMEFHQRLTMEGRGTLAGSI